MKKKLIGIISITLASILVSCSSKAIVEDKNNTQTEENIETIETTKGEELKYDSSLLYIMPKYKEMIYSKAYFRQYVKNELDKLRECYGELADKLNTETMDKAERSIALKNYEQIESFVLKAENNEVSQEEYETLPQTNYLGYIQKETIYDTKERVSESNYSLKVQSVQTNKLYYSFDCDINMPYLISKKDVERLKNIVKEDEDEATIVLEMPINKQGMISSRDDDISTKKTKLYYDGDKGFLYYISGKENDSNQREISIKEYNKDNYAFYEDDYWQIEHKEKKITINILKDANIGKGSDFRQISVADDEYNVGNDDIKYFYDISDLFRRIIDGEPTFLTDKESFKANYLRFDKKGYVTDIYCFEEEE